MTLTEVTRVTGVTWKAATEEDEKEEEEEKEKETKFSRAGGRADHRLYNRPHNSFSLKDFKTTSDPAYGPSIILLFSLVLCVCALCMYVTMKHCQRHYGPRR